MKQWQKIVGLTLMTLHLCACLSLGDSGPAQQFYVLQDARISVVNTAPPVAAKTLLIATSAGSAFYDSVRLAYSQQPPARAYYQFANWTTRPAVRLGQLLMQRLNVHGKLNAAELSGDLQGDWLLNLRVDEFYHDVSVNPGQVRLVVQADLMNRRSQQLLASRTFHLQAEAPTRDAAGAVTGFEAATTLWLDQVSLWVEQAVQ
jgi:cholesterol transport system auxiliary component